MTIVDCLHRKYVSLPWLLWSSDNQIIQSPRFLSRYGTVISCPMHPSGRLWSRSVVPHDPSPTPSFHSSSRYFSVDVECVAVGFRHDARAVGQISLVDEHERVLLNIYVQPEVPVVSYLTPLTGLTRETLAYYGIPLKEAVEQLRRYLHRDAILVGQSIQNDIAWLDLEQGLDFASMVDLAGIYKVWNVRFHSFSVFSLEHLSNVVLGMNGGYPHNAVDDAIKSMKLFNHYRQCGRNIKIWESIKRALLKTAAPLSFARRFPRFEGVCMGNKRTCTCGAPFLG